MKDLYVIIYRQEDKPEELYSTEDLKKAMYVQQALISYGEVTTDNLKKAMDSITEDDINEVASNIKISGRDRLYNETEDAFIIFLPGEESEE